MNWLTNISKTITQGMGDLSPSCKQAIRLQSAALDGKLPFRQHLGLKFHLLLCKWCRRYGKQISFLRTATREHCEEKQLLPAQTLSSGARERIKQKLQSARK